MLRRIFGSRRRKVTAAIFTSVLVAGVSFAAWTIVTASGSGTGKVGSLVAPTISEASAPLGDLYPSVLPTGSIQFEVTNPNEATLYLKEFTVDKSAVAGGPFNCDWSALRNVHLALNGHAVTATQETFPGGFIPPFSIEVAPNDTTVVAVDEVLRLTEDTPDACQGSTISNFQITNAEFSTAP
jgi:hypothetical protein